MNDRLKLLAPDLNRTFPRSPRETLGGYVIAARTLDKCRAELAGTQGEYHFACPLDQIFFAYAGIDADTFRDFVATGSSDAEVAAWIEQHAVSRPRIEIIRWNNGWREKRLSELPDDTMEFMEDYIPQYLPPGRPIYVWFDVYDIEEKRM